MEQQLEEDDESNRNMRAAGRAGSVGRVGAGGGPGERAKARGLSFGRGPWSCDGERGRGERAPVLAGRSRFSRRYICLVAMHSMGRERRAFCGL